MFDVKGIGEKRDLPEATCFLSTVTPNIGGREKGGEFLRVEGGTPLVNLCLTLAKTLGLKQKRFTDSTGLVKQLLV